MLKVKDKSNGNVKTFLKALLMASSRRLEVGCKVNDI
jgi:hypothetical protein